MDDIRQAIHVGGVKLDPTTPSPDPVVVRLREEVGRLKFDLCQCRLELETAREISHRLGTERDGEAFWRAALQAELDSIRATIHALKPLVSDGPLPYRVLQLCNDLTVTRKERDEARTDSTTLRGLLREACEASRFDEQWSGHEIPESWFARAAAALEGKP